MLKHAWTAKENASPRMAGAVSWLNWWMCSSCIFYAHAVDVGAHQIIRSRHVWWICYYCNTLAELVTEVESHLFSRTPIPCSSFAFWIPGEVCRWHRTSSKLPDANAVLQFFTDYAWLLTTPCSTANNAADTPSFNAFDHSKTKSGTWCFSNSAWFLFCLNTRPANWEIAKCDFWFNAGFFWSKT